MKLLQGKALTSRDPVFRDSPQPIYDRLRSNAPLYEDGEYGRVLLTRYDDVNAALRHKSCGVDARKSHADSYMRLVAGTGVKESRGDAAYQPPLVLLDDPDHRRIRALMSKAFNPRSIESMRGRVETVTAALLDGLAGRTDVDFIADFAGPLPTQVILDMMGMSDAPREDFKRWSEDILMGYDPHREEDVQHRLREAYVAMAGAFREAVDARRRRPGDDLISRMVLAQEREDRLTDLEIISLCTQLMVAGNVTTTDLMGNGLYALLTHPDELQRLQSNLELIDDAVEEMLRFDCPITETARIPLEDGELNGCPVRRGDTLTASLSAANHDPGMFTDPHRFRLGRPDNRHLGFGAGIHVCLGAPLARLETRIAMRHLLERFPQIRLDESRPRPRRSLPFFRGFLALPVSLG